MTFDKCNTIGQAMRRTLEKIREYDGKGDTENLQYWRGVLRGVTKAGEIQNESAKVEIIQAENITDIKNFVSSIEIGTTIHIVYMVENEHHWRAELFTKMDSDLYIFNNNPDYKNSEAHFIKELELLLTDNKYSIKRILLY